MKDSTNDRQASSDAAPQQRHRIVDFSNVSRRAYAAPPSLSPPAPSLPLAPLPTSAEPSAPDSGNDWRYARVPAEMKAARRWVSVELRPSASRPGKYEKIGHRARDDAPASHSEPSDWSSFDEAVAAMLRFRRDGIAFALGDGWSGVDFDDVRDKTTGRIDDWTLDEIALLASYTEHSLSGCGVHVITHGPLPTTIGCKGALIEIYDHSRFFAMTGAPIEGSPSIVRDATDALDTLCRRYFPQKFQDKPSARQHYPPIDIDDARLIETAKGAANGATFTAYWEGRWQGLKPSPSEARMGLLSFAASYTHCDPQRMDAWMRQSGLMSPKWDSARGETTLGAIEIARAIEFCDWVYEAPPLAQIQTRGHSHSHGQRARRLAPAAPAEARRLLLQPIGDIAAEPIEYLCEGYALLGELNTLSGAGGSGKTSVAMDFAVRTAGALGMPNGLHSDLTGPVGVIYLTTENHPSKVMRPRMEAAARVLTNGDLAATADLLQRIYVTRGVVTLPDGLPFGTDEQMLDALTDRRSLVLPRDQDVLGEAARARNVRLIILDPAISFTERDLDVLNPADMRHLLDPLALLAQDLNACVWALLHFTKQTSVPIIVRISLSRQVTDTARANSAVLEDPRPSAGAGADTGLRWLAMAKTNMGGDPLAQSFRIDPIEHPAFAGKATAVVRWGETRAGKADALEKALQTEADAEIAAANDALAAANDPLGTRNLKRSPRTQEAIEALAKHLYECFEKGDLVVTADELKAWQNAGGYADATWTKAREHLKVKPTPADYQGVWTQELCELEWLDDVALEFNASTGVSYLKPRTPTPKFPPPDVDVDDLT